jgi:hypothetical protein
MISMHLLKGHVSQDIGFHSEFYKIKSVPVLYEGQLSFIHFINVIVPEFFRIEFESVPR